MECQRKSIAFLKAFGLTAFAVVLWIFSFAGHAVAPPPSVCQSAWQNHNPAELVSPTTVKEAVQRSAWHTKQHEHGVKQIQQQPSLVGGLRRFHYGGYSGGGGYGLEGMAVGFLLGAAFF